MYDQLPAWRDDPDRPDEQSEDKLNLHLCKFLDTRARNDFPMVRFDHEEYQSERRSVDLSASLVKSTLIGARQYTIYDPILVLEGKRLPAPAKDREQEYVTGGRERITGGIQRFKLGLHGAKLDLVAMIGYVQGGSANHWYQEINGWISQLCNGMKADACVWNSSEELEMLEQNIHQGSAHCRSLHERTGATTSSEIMIHHLWILMHSMEKPHKQCV